MQAYTWIFSLAAPLSETQQSTLQQEFDAFAAQWKTHGKDVDGLIRIKHEQFVIVQADPSTDRPSGCSIDSLRRAVTGILQHYQLDTLDASRIFYRDAGDQIVHADFREIQKLLAASEIQADTLVFDHTLSQSDDLDKWEVPLKETWMKRFLMVKK